MSYSLAAYLLIHPNNCHPSHSNKCLPMEFRCIAWGTGCLWLGAQGSGIGFKVQVSGLVRVQVSMCARERARASRKHVREEKRRESIKGACERREESTIKSRESREESIKGEKAAAARKEWMKEPQPAKFHGLSRVLQTTRRKRNRRKWRRKSPWRPEVLGYR